MTYLVTLDPDTEYAATKVVANDDLPGVLRRAFPPYGNLEDGQAIQIRRADYLDTKDGVVVLSGSPVTRHLTLLQGGKDGEQEGREHGCQDPLCSCSV